MPVEVGDEVRLDLTLSDDDPLEEADGEIGEVVPTDLGGEHTHLVRVQIDGETLEILAADHEVQLEDRAVAP